MTRSEACQRVQRIVTFLAERATSYHGAFSHWIDGQTGQTLPFSADDNGADLVETGLLFQGLLTARAYFDGADAAESKLRADITALWEAVEWDFFTKEGTEKVLYWHRRVLGDSAPGRNSGPRKGASVISPSGSTVS